VSTSLTRRVTFGAAHHYWRADWSDDENRRVFGSRATPRFHGHEYACDVTITGEVDRVSGMLVDLGFLDRILQTEVRDRFDHHEINLDVPSAGRRCRARKMTRGHLPSLDPSKDFAYGRCGRHERHGRGCA